MTVSNDYKKLPPRLLAIWARLLSVSDSVNLRLVDAKNGTPEFEEHDKFRHDFGDLTLAVRIACNFKWDDKLTTIIDAKESLELLEQKIADETEIRRNNTTAEVQPSESATTVQPIMTKLILLYIHLEKNLGLLALIEKKVRKKLDNKIAYDEFQLIFPDSFGKAIPILKEFYQALLLEIIRTEVKGQPLALPWR